MNADVKDIWVAVYDQDTHTLYSKGTFEGRIAPKSTLNERGLWWCYAVDEEGNRINPQEDLDTGSWEWMPESLCFRKVSDDVLKARRIANLKEQLAALE